jgi:hypothetical protein
MRDGSIGSDTAFEEGESTVVEQVDSSNATIIDTRPLVLVSPSASGTTNSGTFISRPSMIAVTTRDQQPKVQLESLNPFGLHVVYEPVDGARANIVFVHGLGGTSQMTWSKSGDPELFWPRKFLPLEQDICQARILTFGYNASVYSKGESSMTILDFAKNLLHSLKHAKTKGLEDLQMNTVGIQIWRFWG